MEKRTIVIGIKVSKSEHSALQKAAWRAGLPISTYLRFLALKETDKKETERKDERN